jgi:predicted ABC-type ATPase
VKPPSLTFIAGPNGAGKSTLTSGNLDFFSAFPLLDPDALANAIQADNRGKHPIAAGREVLVRIQQHLKNRRTFAVETTLSGKVYLQTMLEARNLGFHVSLIYVGTSDVRINLGRVAQRVELDGHNVPEADIRRRYRRSLNNLLIAVRRADLVILFDNSRPILASGGGPAYDLVAVIENGNDQWFEPIPVWAAPVKALLGNR